MWHVSQTDKMYALLEAMAYSSHKVHRIVNPIKYTHNKDNIQGLEFHQNIPLELIFQNPVVTSLCLNLGPSSLSCGTLHIWQIKSTVC